MKIVVLDGYTLNPGDLSWQELETLGDLEVYDRTSSDQVIERAGEAEIVLTNKTILSADSIKQLTRLKYIGVLATGYNVVDTEAARERNIPVTNVPGYATQSVAQLVFAHLLNLTHHTAHHAQTVREGKWSHSKDFCYWDFPLIELADLTMGIIGLGQTGKATARIALALGMRILAYDISDSPSSSESIEMVSLEEVFRQSDVVSLHCPLTPMTKDLVNKERLALMKKTALLINTGRGPLVDEKDLAEALNNEQIAGAGLDVLVKEPPDLANPLLKAKNCSITPHIAWATRAGRNRLMTVAVDNVRSFLAGKPQNIIKALFPKRW